MPSRGDRVNQKTGNRDKYLFVYPSPDEAQRYRRELQEALEAVRERKLAVRRMGACAETRHYSGGKALLQSSGDW